MTVEMLEKVEVSWVSIDGSLGGSAYHGVGQEEGGLEDDANGRLGCRVELIDVPILVKILIGAVLCSACMALCWPFNNCHQPLWRSLLVSSSVSLLVVLSCMSFFLLSFILCHKH